MNIRLHHAAIYATDLEHTKAFFLQYFNAEVHPMYHNPRTGLNSCFLSLPGGGAQLEIMNRPETKSGESSPAYASGLHHLSFSVGSKENVDALTNRLREDGYALLDGPRTTGDGFYESCIEGPDGILIEITV